MKNSKGFTLLEVIIVVAIIGILSAIAIPSYTAWLPGYHLKGAARDLYSNMQKARMLAVKENRNITVRFDSSATPGFYYFDNDGNSAYTSGEYRVDLSSYKSSIDFGNGNATNNWNNSAISQAAVITFSSQGTANNGSIYIENFNNDVSYAITIQISGSVKLRKYDGKTPFNTNNWK